MSPEGDDTGRLPARRTVAVAVAVIALGAAVLATGAGLYFAVGAGPEEAAVNAVESSSAVTVERLDGLTVVRSGPVTAETVGLAYYPGARVNPESYVPTAAATVAGRDVAVVIVDVPLNLAVLGPNRADDARAALPAVESWYVGGHSLGGAMACRYAAANAVDLDGLVLHAAYCDSDVSESGLRVLSVLGGADGVIDADRERESRSNLPDDARVIELDGVNHAGFGAYGPQRGDESVSTDPAAARDRVGTLTGRWLVEAPVERRIGERVF
ncbi:alpha/beta hydrolase [Halorubrum sp. Hd13]|uniref:alpha/beta hydrolase n=1 Tax=Halorubrum sp. Hd13 TaxID=1480728 RepID=UPI000BD84BD9|nr:alpha/beta hydrolase [Halorubrum sp. Hd13]OYR41920.1 alpha/beta hydrolase [Halorubrum sp. Hd13]